MVQVTLEKEWTDPRGHCHPAGSTVEVDAGTLAELQASAVVADPDGGGWVGPDGGGTGTTGGGWVGPDDDPTD